MECEINIEKLFEKMKFKKVWGSFVLLGDASKVRIHGCGTLNIQGLPPLNNMLLVEGLKVNLIGIRVQGFGFFGSFSLHGDSSKV